jgi:beta-1,4-mannosyltransferase
MAQMKAVKLGVAMIPRSPWWRENPYLGLLETGLKEHGVEIASDANDELSWKWLLRNRQTFKVLHFHWLQYHYDRKSLLQSVLALALFSAKLAFARLLGYRLIWTMHNITPHEPHYPVLDRFCWNLMARLSHHAIVHCNDAREQLAQRYGRRQHVSVIPHPSYIGCYPQAPGQAEARRMLGLAEDARVYLYVGAIRPYKGVLEAIREFQKLEGEDLRFVITGRPLDEAMRAEVLELAGKDARIHTRLEYISDSDVTLYLSAADLVVLPFRQVATSGSVMLAMSMGRPVLTPAMGCLPELISDETGILYDPKSTTGLEEAMRKSLQCDLKLMGKNAYECVAAFTPYLVAERLLAVYPA